MAQIQYKADKPKLKEHAKKWFKQGISKAEIARMLCRDEKTIRVWLKEDAEKAVKAHNLKVKNDRISKTTKVINMLDKGFKISEICKTLLVTRDYVLSIKSKIN